SAKKSALPPLNREYVSPARDWFVGLCIATACLVSGCVYVVLDFYNQVHTSLDASELKTDVVTYNERDVVRYAEIYTKKSAVFETMRVDRRFVAPSEEEVADEAENGELLQNEGGNSTLILE